MILFIVFSCQQENEAVQQTQEIIQVDFINPQVVKTDQDRVYAQKIVEITRALRAIYQDPEIVQEVNAAILTGYYADESVLLKDLLAPEISPLYKSESFQLKKREHKFAEGLFAKRFKEELPKYTKQALAGRVSDMFFIDYVNNVSIYFPYSEDTQYSSYPTTVVAATDETDAAYAQHPLCDDITPQTYAYCNQFVLVNDDYASVNPVHIVGMGAANSTTNQFANCSGNLLVKVGYMRCKKQYDKLISFTGNGGKSEIKIGRANAAAVTNPSQQVTGFTGDLMSVDFSRKEIRNNTWKEINGIWDTNWPSGTTEQVLAIWEEDTQGTKNFTGPIKIPFVGTLTTYNISVVTQDEIIRNWNIDRVFLTSLGQTNQGNGFVGGWPILDGGRGFNVSYTLPLLCY
ncbi:MAG: hypothetical protein KF775_14455 [Cyclobacteriaceae bacterium]|nr:hypothetical protein [Cyclobacteriaceae bacterium]